MINGPCSEELKDILKGIHECGVLHGDLRALNVLMDEKGTITMIDFDHASRRASAEDYEAETERLDRFLAGAYIDGEPAHGPDDVNSELKDMVESNCY